MRITTIRYAKLVNLGDYRNERFEATAEREEGESAEDVAHQLAGYVDQVLADRAAERQVLADREAREARIRYAKQQLAQYNDELARLTEKAEDDRTDWERRRLANLPGYIASAEKTLADPDAPEDPAGSNLPF